MHSVQVVRKSFVQFLFLMFLQEHHLENSMIIFILFLCLFEVSQLTFSMLEHDKGNSPPPPVRKLSDLLASKAD